MKKVYVVFCLLFVMLFTSCYVQTEKELEKELYKLCEQAYFEGQRDALEGDVRIKKDDNGCWIWTKSPWNTGKQPEFDPSFNCE
ncbi:hypothetical protein M0Q97_13875 [Candidatus Dojkabacteria bacterium]|jgi:hypothetical protein|nr:hypothetical protein [Candidatus Dojkabacteria bacterium]